MSRAKKDGEAISFYMSKDVANLLRQYADEKGQTLTTAVERLILKQIEVERMSEKPEKQKELY